MAKKQAVPKRKDILKLIDNLTNGQYNKGKGNLVDQTRTNFCCLGVWADQHGCVFHHNSMSGWIPSLPGKNPPKYQDGSILQDQLSFGLDHSVQHVLTNLNDSNPSWDEVISYLAVELLPTLKR